MWATGLFYLPLTTTTTTTTLTYKRFYFSIRDDHKQQTDGSARGALAHHYGL